MHLNCSGSNRKSFISLSLRLSSTIGVNIPTDSLLFKKRSSLYATNDTHVEEHLVCIYCDFRDVQICPRSVVLCASMAWEVVTGSFLVLLPFIIWYNSCNLAFMLFVYIHRKTGTWFEVILFCYVCTPNLLYIYFFFLCIYTFRCIFIVKFYFLLKLRIKLMDPSVVFFFQS